MDLIHHPPRN